METVQLKPKRRAMLCAVGWMWNRLSPLRAFPSIPARHDLARRADADWIASLVVRGIVDMDDAAEMIHDTAYRLAKKAYKFD